MFVNLMPAKGISIDDYLKVLIRKCLLFDIVTSLLL